MTSLRFIVDPNLIHASCSACGAAPGRQCQADSPFHEHDRFHIERLQGLKHLTFGDVRALCGRTIRAGQGDQRSGDVNCQPCLDTGYAVAHAIVEVTRENRAVAARLRTVQQRQKISAAYGVNV